MNTIPAHDATPSPGSEKPVHLNLDATGMSMSLRTMAAFITGIISIVLVLAGGWYSFLLTTATKADLKEHNVDVNGIAHPVLLQEEKYPIGSAPVVQKHDKEIKTISTTMKAVTDDLLTVKNGFIDDRAERLADRAADKVKNKARSREMWKHVKDKAKQNLEEGKPIRAELRELL